MRTVSRCNCTITQTLFRRLGLATVLCALLGLAAPSMSATKVAFIGDQGISEDARRVLELIRDEGTDLLLIQGDLGYFENAAQTWINNIDSILGRDFPVLIVVGNHENYEWPAYQQWQRDKLARTSDVRCEGEVGEKAYCTYRNIGIVQAAPAIDAIEGVNGYDDFPGYITEKLNGDNSDWRFCSWHKNMRDMQAGAKPDATGWGVYQSCLAQGGIVVTGHEHSYSRTYLMNSFEGRSVIHKSSEMEIGPNSSIAIVSGLGGHQVRPQVHGGDWFASIYTRSQGATHGALFCDFSGVRGDCYMKDVAGRVPDTFTLTSTIAKARATNSQAAADEAARLQAEAAAAEQARIDAAAAEQARIEAAAAEQARIDAEAAAERARVEAAAAEQARIEAAAAAEQARIQAAAAEQAQREAAAAEQARQDNLAAERAWVVAAELAWVQAEAAEQARLAAIAAEEQAQAAQAQAALAQAAQQQTPAGASNTQAPSNAANAPAAPTAQNTNSASPSVPTSIANGSTPLLSDRGASTTENTASASDRAPTAGGTGALGILFLAGFWARRRSD